jgi:hypothetical protein
MRFIDEVNPATLLRLSLRREPAGTVWVFEPVALGMSRWLRRAQRSGLIRADVRQVPWHAGDIRSAEGHSGYLALLAEARSLGRMLVERWAAHDPVVRVYRGLWGAPRVLFYLEKVLEREITRDVLRAGLAGWIARRDATAGGSTLLMQGSPWFEAVAARAGEDGLTLIRYRMIGAGVPGGLTEFFRQCRRALKCRGMRPAPGGAAPARGARQAGRIVPVIALRYWYRTLSLDPADRSEFFWLDGESPGGAEVLLYCHTGAIRADGASADELASRGIRIVQDGPRLTLMTARVFGRLMARGAAGAMRAMVRGERVSWYLCRTLERLVRSYACWDGFFARHGIRVHVAALNPDLTDVGMTLALDARGGVSLAYQYSISNFLHPTTFVSAGEHVQFVFSRACEQLWRSVRAPVERLVPTGFIYDRALGEVRGSDCARRMREALQGRGATFILCFFDENSMERWDSYASDESAAADYEYLLRWVLDDPEFGLICKPKKSATLLRRVGRLAPLIEEAQRTGRCQFLMDADTLVSKHFPAEAAMAADACAGKLSGGTAAFEARLAGAPTALIDTEGFSTHPFRDVLARGRVIFDDWSSFRDAVNRYRRSPGAFREFGDWGRFIADFDPYRDGCASKRMAEFIAELVRGLESGLSREEALSRAGRRADPAAAVADPVAAEARS